MTAAETIAGFATSLTLDDIPIEVAEDAKLHVLGVLGGAAAVARVAGADAETTTRSLGIVGSMASGLFAYLADGTPTKPIHPAWAAHGAHIAARLAHHGASGPQSVIEGKFGLYHA